MSRALNRRVFLASSAAVASGLALQGAAPASAASNTIRVPDIDVRKAARQDPSRPPSPKPWSSCGAES